MKPYFIAHIMTLIHTTLYAPVTPCLVLVTSRARLRIYQPPYTAVLLIFNIGLGPPRLHLGLLAVYIIFLIFDLLRSGSV
jgi:hypothetical protein